MTICNCCKLKTGLIAVVSITDESDHDGPPQGTTTLETTQIKFGQGEIIKCYLCEAQFDCFFDKMAHIENCPAIL